jgi:outer membrane protein OmpA-like peptidoglycan-associated protein|uniref:OmpA family protein n=1 Tax=Gelidibacter sp. TaxID=2018083 RepID=UPI00404B0226
MKQLLSTLVVVFIITNCFGQNDNHFNKVDTIAKNPFEGFTRNIEFKISTTELIYEYTDEFNEILSLIKKYSTNDKMEFIISGHTNSVGSKERNKELSLKRAEKIKSILVEKGCNPNILIAIGYGEEKPIASNKTLSGRKENSRIEIIAVENK